MPGTRVSFLLATAVSDSILHTLLKGRAGCGRRRSERGPNGRIGANRLLSEGFTLVELVVILIVVGVLAATALPRFSERQTFDARGFYDQVLSMARYAQKLAIAQHTDVYFNADGGTGAVCLTYVADATCASPVGVVNPANGQKFGTAPASGVTIGPSVSFSFSALGKPNPDAAVVLNVVGGGMTRTITVERETGYVH